MIRQTIKVATLIVVGLTFHASSLAQDPINDCASCGSPGKGQYQPISGSFPNLFITNPSGNTLSSPAGNPVELNLIGGDNNTIQDNASGGSFANLAYGLGNQITASGGSMAFGEQNDILESDFSYAFGSSNVLDNTSASVALGENVQLNAVNTHGYGQEISAASSQSMVLGYGTGTNNLSDIGSKTITLGIKANPVFNVQETSNPNNDPGVTIGTSNIGTDKVRIQSNGTGSNGNNALNIIDNGGGDLMQIQNDGQVGIGLSSVTSGFLLEVNGDIKCTGISTVSDAALKKDVNRVKKPLNRIMKLNGVSYQFDNEKAPNKNLPNGKEIGFIAQEVEEVFPSLVTSPEDGWSSINYQAMVPVLTEGLKKQQEQIKQQRNEIDNLKARVRQLEAQVKSENRNAGSDLSQNNGRNKLENNAPNPFNQKTTIGYQVGNGQDARINVYNMNGRQLESYQVESGQGELTISANTFKAGMYMYNMMVDGEVVSTKRMVITANQ